MTFSTGTPISLSRLKYDAEGGGMKTFSMTFSEIDFDSDCRCPASIGLSQEEKNSDQSFSSVTEFFASFMRTIFPLLTLIVKQM